MSTREAVLHMCQGNPGAATVIGQLLKETGGLDAMIHLDDLKFYADKIWVAYKDFCKCNIDVFIEKCVIQDKEMVRYVNELYSGDILRSEA